MKKLALAMFLAVSVVSASHAVDLKGSGSYGMAGCGLGSMAFKDNDKLSQLLATCTNGTFGTQTFGISSGTSNCTSNGVAKIEKETEMFVEVNRSTLQKEMSQGKGETLTSFSTIMGCSDSKAFSKTLQSNYKNISSAQGNEQFLNTVKTTIESDASLSKTCKTVASR